jgi:hypothetical protein
VLVLLARGADLGRAAGVVLEALLDRQSGAGGPDDRLWLGYGVEKDHVGGVEDPRGGLLAAQALVGLWGEHERGAVGAHHLGHPCHARSVGDRRELVDDQKDLLSLRLAPGDVLLEVLDQEAREL